MEWTVRKESSQRWRHVTTIACRVNRNLRTRYGVDELFARNCERGVNNMLKRLPEAVNRWLRQSCERRRASEDPLAAVPVHIAGSDSGSVKCRVRAQIRWAAEPG